MRTSWTGRNWQSASRNGGNEEGEEEGKEKKPLRKGDSQRSQ